MGCAEKIKHSDELKKRNFGFYHDQPHLFHRSQWPIPPALYLLFRYILAAYLTGVKIYSIYLSWHGGKHFIFLTNWTYLILTLSFVSRAVTATVYHVCSKRSEKGGITRTSIGHLPWYVCCGWVLYNVANVGSLLVTLTYWTAMYHNQGLVFMNFNVHAVNSIIVLLDLLVTARPTRLFHVYQPMLYVATYGIFNLIYWAAGGTDVHGNHFIYAVFDWGGSPKFAALFASGTLVIGVPIVHLLVFALHKLRVFISHKFGKLPLPPKSSEVELSSGYI